MKFEIIQSALITLACAGTIASPLVAQQPRLVAQAKTRGLVFDVQLDDGHGLRGEVRGANGQLKKGTDVALWKETSLMGQVRTDSQGQFRFAELRGGRYRVATADSVVACRAWTAGLAPPNARQSLLVVTNVYSTRGQQPINEVFCFNPFLMGTIVAAAIAIPIAVHDSGDGQLPDGS